MKKHKLEEVIIHDLGCLTDRSNSDDDWEYHYKLLKGNLQDLFNELRGNNIIKFTNKEKKILLEAMDNLIDLEQDTIDHTKIINKLRR